jgi:hypothetical protein
MPSDETEQIEVSVSDYSEIGALQRWLSAVDGVRVSRLEGQPGDGQQGVLDALVLAAGGGAAAALRTLPEFLRARRSGLSITTTFKGRKFRLDATNVDEVMPIIERFLDE